MKEKDVLVVSYIGYLTQSVSVGKQTSFIITLKEDTQALDEVVVVGYGVQKKRDLSGAVSSVKSRDITAIPTTNALEALQGKVAGLDLTASSGKAGADLSFTIRGERSLKASNAPLILVDGIDYGTTLDINPSDIESIEVLKDASSTAIYGTRGANGIIIVTTKKGKAGKSKVSLNAFASINMISSYPSIMNGAEYAQLKREAYRDQTTNEYLPDEQVFTVAQELEYVREGVSTDYRDLMMSNGFNQNYELSITGGTEKNNFAARFRKAFNAAFDAMIERYKKGVLFFIKRKWMVWTLLAASVVLLAFLMNTTKTSLVPDEDQGVVFVNVSTAAGSSLKTTNDVMMRIEKRMMDIPQVLHVQRVAGYGLLAGQGNSFGMLILKLKPWDERKGKENDVQAVIGQVYGRTADIKDASIFAISPGMIPGYGMGNALELHMQDKLGGDIGTFFNTTQQYLGALNQRPEIAMAYSTFDIRYPQWTVEVDASKCKRAGITPDAVLSTLSGYYGGQYVSNFNRFSKVYKVMIQADPKYRVDEASLNNIFVRMSNGEMAPLSQFVHLTRSYGAESLSRFNMFNSIAVNAMPAEGYSTGDAIRAVQETAVQALPKGFGYDFGGITREETDQGGTTIIIFGICFLMIYLILSALYESFLIPFAVLLSVPFGLMGSFLFAKMMGLENNIYLQTGLIMLIGLLAKTAILLTEYATERRKAGMSLTSAALSAAKARLRPILMTALTMIFGLFPLMVASGVGANGNSSLGTGTVGGMVIGTLALLFIVPSLFIVFQYLQEKVRPIQFQPASDWQIQEEYAEAVEERQHHIESKKEEKK